MKKKNFRFLAFLSSVSVLIGSRHSLERSLSYILWRWDKPIGNGALDFLTEDLLEIQGQVEQADEWSSSFGCLEMSTENYMEEKFKSVDRFELAVLCPNLSEGSVFLVDNIGSADMYKDEFNTLAGRNGQFGRKCAYLKKRLRIYIRYSG